MKLNDIKLKNMKNNISYDIIGYENNDKGFQYPHILIKLSFTKKDNFIKIISYQNGMIDYKFLNQLDSEKIIDYIQGEYNLYIVPSVTYTRKN